MTSFVLFTIGAALVLVVSCDFLRTTVSLTGTGFLSRTIAGGPWCLGSIWVLMHLCGYVLIFRGGLSLVHAETGAPTTWVLTMAFAGSTFSTLGASTAKMTSGGWGIVSMIAATNGMFLLILSVSFLLSILQTTNSARTFASRFRTLKVYGPEGEASQRIAGLGPDLSRVVVMLIASPLPGFFVPNDPAMDFSSAIIELCVLAEDGALVETSEIVAAMKLLGRHPGTSSDRDDLAAACCRAEHHTIVRTDSR